MCHVVSPLVFFTLSRLVAVKVNRYALAAGFVAVKVVLFADDFADSLAR